MVSKRGRYYKLLCVVEIENLLLVLLVDLRQEH